MDKKVSKLIEENTELKEKIKELETELYFRNRNNKIVGSTDNIYESPNGGETIYKRRIGSDRRVDISRRKG